MLSPLSPDSGIGTSSAARPYWLSAMHFPLPSMGQASATLCTAAGEHFTAVGSAHPLAEAVLLGALALLRLVGTEHAIHLFLIVDYFLRQNLPLLDSAPEVSSDVPQPTVFRRPLPRTGR